MKIVITSATALEWKDIRHNINPLYTQAQNKINVIFHISGVGTLLSTYSLTQLMLTKKPDLVIQVGIAGSFTPTLPPGTVTIVQHEYMGDTGVFENNQFYDIFDLQLENQNEFPFQNKCLSNPWLTEFNLLKLPAVTGVTVNEVSTSSIQINRLINKYGAQIESMEGAPLHFTGLSTQTPFIQLRAISNFVGERDKSKWHIKLALNNLTYDVLKLIDALHADQKINNLQ